MALNAHFSCLTGITISIHENIGVKNWIHVKTDVIIRFRQKEKMFEELVDGYGHYHVIAYTLAICGQVISVLAFRYN